MVGYVYLTTNLVNGKKYIGKHKSSYFNPEYKGPGKLIRRAINKYGWSNFKVELLLECNSLEELNQAEINEISRRNAVGSDEYYNIAGGGEGWSSSIWSNPDLHQEMVERFTGEGNPFYGKHHSKDTISRQVATRRKKYETDPVYRQRISDCQKGKKATQKTRDKMSKSISKGKKGKVAFNNGERVIYRDPSEEENLKLEGFVRGDLPHSRFNS